MICCGDAEKRRRFDAGEIDASGQERPERQYYHHYASQDAGERYDGGFAWIGQDGFGQGFGRGRTGQEEDLSDLFSDLFGRRQPSAGGGAHRSSMPAAPICATSSRSTSSMPRAARSAP